jgi:hypothetical protein
MICEELREVPVSHDKHHHNLSQGLPLPLDYEESIACLQLMLSNLLAFRARDLTGMMMEATSFQAYFEYKKIQRMDAARVRAGFVEDPARYVDAGLRLLQDDPLFWCLKKLVWRTILRLWTHKPCWVCCKI